MRSATDIQPSDFEFTIDKTSPQVLEIYPQTIDEDIQISADKFIKASDNNDKLTLIWHFQAESKMEKLNVYAIFIRLLTLDITKKKNLIYMSKLSL